MSDKLNKLKFVGHLAIIGPLQFFNLAIEVGERAFKHEAMSLVSSRFDLAERACP